MFEVALTYKPATKDYIHNFVSGIKFPQKYVSVTRDIFLEWTSRKFHYMYSFVIQRITWKHYLGIIFFEILISVTEENVLGINFATVWGVKTQNERFFI